MNKYKGEDIILKSDFTLITSHICDDIIIVTAYSRHRKSDNWIVYDDFKLTLKDFAVISSNISFLNIYYNREVLTSEM